MASIARVLAESAKKAGNDTLQLEYLTVLALSGRITADETKEFEAAYRKTHNGSLDGLEAMLDDRYRRDHTRFAVTPVRAEAAGEGHRQDRARRGVSGRGLTAVRGGGSRLRCRARSLHPERCHRPELPRAHPGHPIRW